MKTKIIHYIKVIMRTPFKILIPMVALRVKSGIVDLYNYRKVKVKGFKLTDDEFLKELRLNKRSGGIKDLLSKQLIDSNFLNSILNMEDKEFIRKEINGNNKNKIIEDADKICKHIFNILGTGEVNLSYFLEPEGFEGNVYDEKLSEDKINGYRKKIDKKIKILFPESNKNKNIEYEPIDWHRDFKSGYRWDENTWHKKIKYGHIPGIDIKIPWEVSRSQHMIILGQAYVLTGDDKYVKEYMYQLIDWIENNTVQFGPNWTCTMDVAIRAANWVISLSYFRDSDYITDKFLLYLVKSIYSHGKHIVNNLEYGSITSNHYLSDISGLFFIASLLGKNQTGKKWKNFSISELKTEMGKQVYDDGVDFESSTCYHRLVLELFFYPVLYAVKNSNKFNLYNSVIDGEKYFGKDYIDKLKSMFKFVLSTLKPDGTISQIGDNDNGRLFIFSDSKILDLRYLLTYAAIFFKDNSFKIKEYGFNDGALWLLGKKGLAAWNGLDSKNLSDVKSKAFRDSGFFIMRNNKDYLFSSCGPNGQKGNGGHVHNDKLGFELVFEGENIMIDPGTFVYTPSPRSRNMFRSTSFHNTVVVDGVEQNRFKDTNLFSLENDSRATINKWNSDEERDYLDAEHHGYNRLDDPVKHKRQIMFIKKERLWLIKDILYGKQLHTYELFFHLFPGLNIEIDKKAMISNIKIKSGIDLFIVPCETNGLSLKIEESMYSGGYGNKRMAKTIKFMKKSSGNVCFLKAISRLKDIKDINNILENNEAASWIL